MAGEDQEVQISEDQSLKEEVQQMTIKDLAWEDQEVQTSKGEQWRVLGLIVEGQVQISGDHGLNGELLIWRPLALSGKDLDFQISVNHILKRGAYL